MAVSSQRGQKIFEIDPKNLKIKGYASAYLKDNSLNITSGVPILIIDDNPNWIDICIPPSHPFYNLLEDLSKDNHELHDRYFDFAPRSKDVIFLRAKGENLQKIKQYCKLDVKVRVLLNEEVILSSNDPEYLSECEFLLDINRIEFV